MTQNNYKIMSMYDCQNKSACSFRQNVRKVVADVLGPAVANVQSLTVAQSDGRASRRLVVDDVSLAYQQHGQLI